MSLSTDEMTLSFSNRDLLCSASTLQEELSSVQGSSARPKRSEEKSTICVSKEKGKCQRQQLTDLPEFGVSRRPSTEL